MLPGWVAPYVGLPYRAGGRDRSGVDCWGLYALVCREALGIPIPDYEGPLWDASAPRGPIAAAAMAFAARFTPVQPGQEQPGDGILMRMVGVPVHIGMIVSPGRMLHIEAGADACVEDYGSFRWARRVAGIYRHIGGSGGGGSASGG